ncbi:MAG: hypothetical protein ACKOEO_20300 [Planctomycetaceae bacterium]
MWCRHCLREVSPGHGGSASLACPFCGRGLEAVTAQSQAVRQAREILERWQASDLFDRITNSDVLPEHKSQPKIVPAALPQPERFQPEQAAPTPRRSTPTAITTPAAMPPKPELPRLPIPTATPEQTAKSVIRELPPLPLDVLAPSPVMATAISPAPRRSQTDTSKETPTTVHTDHWEPPPRHGNVAESTEFAASSPNPTHAPPTHTTPPNTPPQTETEAAIAAFFESSSADLFSAAEEQSPVSAPLCDVPKTPEPVPAPPVEIEHAPPVMAVIPAPVEIDVIPTTLANQDTTPDETPNPQPAPNQQPALADSAPVVSSHAISAAAEDSPVTTQATHAKPRPALRRPPLTRRVSAPTEPVQPTPGTIIMNRNITPEPSAQQPVIPPPVTPAAIAPPTPVAVSNSPESGIRERRDAAEPTGGERPHLTGWTRPPQRYIDERHEPPVRGPHFEVSPPPRSNFTTIIGQGLAYIGVIALLIGTSLVILGHFGGESDYTPTGWLITTVAQMLLFLGIINLVSGGMEQHNDEVARRIHSLSEHLIRIEQTTTEAVMAARQAGNARAEMPETDLQTASAVATTGERRRVPAQQV